MSHRIFTVVLAATLVTGVARTALADDPPAPRAPSLGGIAGGPAVDAALAEEAAPAPPARASRAWYGWQTLLIDGVSLGTVPLEVGAGASFSNTPSASYLLFGSLTTYTLGAPIVHMAHGHFRRGALDFGLRAGAVAVGSLAGAAIGGSPSSCDGRLAGCLGTSGNGLLAGAAIGAALASVIDASFLTWDARPAELGASPKLRVSPLAQASGRGGVAGIMGEF